MNLTEQTEQKAGKGMTVATEKTGQNEVTQILKDGTIVVLYNSTQVIVADPNSQTVDVFSGRWRGVDTTEFMNRSIERLHGATGWVPLFRVSIGGGALRVVGGVKPDNVFFHDG